MWQTIRNTLLRWLLSLLDPNFKAELDAFDQIKATKQREREALQKEIAEIDWQIIEAKTRQQLAQSELQTHLAEVEKTEAEIKSVKNEKPVDTSNIDDAAALRDKL